MQSPAPSAVDADRRRAASRLAELVRAGDADLEAYARRHAPGRAVDPDGLRALRALLLATSRLLDAQGALPGAAIAAAEAAAKVTALVDALSADLPEPPGPAPTATPVAEPAEAPALIAPLPVPPPPVDAPPPVPPAPVGAPLVPIEDPLTITKPPTTAPPSLPFQRKRELPPHLGALTLAQHATLTAALLAYPGQEAQVFARYGLQGAADREALDDHWLRVLSQDPELARQWRELRDRTLQYYRSGA